MEVKDSLTIKVNTSEVYDDKGNRWEDLYNDLVSHTEHLAEQMEEHRLSRERLCQAVNMGHTFATALDQKDALLKQVESQNKVIDAASEYKKTYADDYVGGAMALRRKDLFDTLT